MKAEKTAYSDQLYSYYLTLLRSALNGTHPTPPPSGVSPAELFLYSVSNCTSHMIWKPLAESGAEIPENIAKSFTAQYVRALSCDVVQRTAYEEMANEFTSAGVSVLPLKGTVLKRYYPNTAMRYMSDIDIAYDAQDDNEKVRKIMEKLGYECVSWGRGHHDIYCLKPTLNVELHRRRDNKYLFDAPSGLVSDADRPLRFDHTPQDLYVILLRHDAVHMRSSSLGVRAICDFYTLKKQFGELLDDEYTRSRVAFFGLEKFERKINGIVSKWFSAPVVSFDLGDYTILNSRTYGGDDDAELSKLVTQNKVSKSGYIFSRIFPSFGTMKDIYPILKKLPFLLPFCWVVRAFSIVFSKRRRKIVSAFGTTLQSDSEKINTYTKVFNEFGLDELKADEAED